MAKENSNIISLINNNVCFDLQFRKDTRHERTNSPTYYRWKAQFIVTAPKENLQALKVLQGAVGCGKIHIIKDQARFSVQDIEELQEKVITFLEGKVTEKKKDFELWQKAVGIISENKGKAMINWKKSDLSSLLNIHKTIIKNKSKSRPAKWIKMAEVLASKS